MFKKLFSLFFGFFGKQEPKAESELYDKYNTPVLKEKLTLPAAIDELAKSEFTRLFNTKGEDHGDTE